MVNRHPSQIKEEISVHARERIQARLASSEQYPESSGAQQAWQPPQQTTNQVLLDAMMPEMPDIPVGGHLKHFVHRWKNITSDSSVLDIVTEMHIELLEF